MSGVIERVSGLPITECDTNLFELGIKSIDMLMILGNLENEFNVEFDESTLTRENFASVRSIDAVIQRLLEESEGS